MEEAMLNFFRGKVQRWASKAQREEMQYFIDMLEGADLDARALVVPYATDFRNTVLTGDEFLRNRAEGTLVNIPRPRLSGLAEEGIASTSCRSRCVGPHRASYD